MGGLFAFNRGESNIRNVTCRWHVTPTARSLSASSIFVPPERKYKLTPLASTKNKTILRGGFYFWLRLRVGVEPFPYNYPPLRPHSPRSSSQNIPHNRRNISPVMLLHDEQSRLISELLLLKCLDSFDIVIRNGHIFALMFNCSPPAHKHTKLSLKF